MSAQEPEDLAVPGLEELKTRAYYARQRVALARRMRDAGQLEDDDLAGAHEASRKAHNAVDEAEKKGRP